jgi:lipoprotein-anchoring transpeptidase ErfK/SrfK
MGLGTRSLVRGSLEPIMRLRRRALVATAAVLAGSMLTMAFVIVTAPPERSVDPALGFARASTALEEARVAGASARAPINLAGAEEAFADGLVARRRQELRPRLLRDYRDVHAAFARAASLGEAATEIATGHTDRDRDNAAESIARAASVLDPLEGVEDRVWMANDLRGRLQQARTLADQAGSLLASGAHDQADRRAQDARAAGALVADSVLGITARYSDEEQLRTWRAWADETVAWSARTGKAAIVVAKDEHRLTFYEDGRAVRTYDAELGWNNAADKRIQGDGATPEGRYFITEKKGAGSSRYHKALLLDYPNGEDLRTLDKLKRAGVLPRSARAGGLIEIHGEGGRGKDWTDGCVAVSNAEMDQLFARVAVGTPVTIVGSRSGEGLFSMVTKRLGR